MRHGALVLLWMVSLFAGGALGQTYSGPNDPATLAFTGSGVTRSSFSAFLAAVCPTGLGTTCGVSYGVACSAGPVYTGGSGPAIGATINTFNKCLSTDGGTTWSSNGSNVGTPVEYCATNRHVAFVGSAWACVSMCYPDLAVPHQVSIAITDPAATVVNACATLAVSAVRSGTDLNPAQQTLQCKLEVSEAQNYTFGTSLQRVGVYVGDGEKCVEDPSTTGTLASTSTQPTNIGGSSGDDSAGALTSGDNPAPSVPGAGTVDYSALPGFGSSGRWTFSFGPWLPSATATCVVSGFEWNGWATGDFDFCPWVGYWLDFGYWLFALLTAWRVWHMFYNRSGEVA